MLTQWDGKVSEVKPVAPLYSYAAVSFSNVVATTCQYEALKFVSFPVQTLGKCAKMLPVMVWGIIMMRKKYSAKDFGLACAITGGCTLFLMTGSVKSKVRCSWTGGQALHYQQLSYCEIVIPSVHSPGNSSSRHEHLV